ncbi:helix-turn-helix domain containing protein [Arthrobacter sp. GMC3]|uniref:helix-turn-helix domain containing protein n=1 Tax=Arthrobacter sp. GMC3 TaxID=2058894 RepID=UPI000CE4703E|nr:helix-turn-helix domain containing protein [Arthrobacter sp. GMC3]
MVKPISDTTRQQIIDLHTFGTSRNAIAKEAGVAPSTVSKVCKAAGLDFDRTGTRAATASKVIDAKARRAELKELLLEDAHRLRKQLWEPTVVFNFGGKDNTYEESQLPEPIFADKKNILSAVGIAVDKVEKLEKLDNDGGVQDAESMIQKLIDGIGIPDE